MDVILHLADDYFLDSVWAALWPALPRSGPAKVASPSQAAIANLSSHISGAWGNNAGGAGDMFTDTKWVAPAAGKAVSALSRDSMIR